MLLLSLLLSPELGARLWVVASVETTGGGLGETGVTTPSISKSKRKAEKGKAPMDEPLKAKTNRSQQLLGLIRSISTYFTTATYEEPRTPIISADPPQEHEVNVLEVTPLHILPPGFG